MKRLLHKIAFHKNGTPRERVFAILFRKGVVVRGPFQRVVYKSNGKMRPAYEHWLRRAMEQDRTQADEVPAGSRPHSTELILRNLIPLEERVRHWRGRKEPATPLLDSAAIARLLAGTPDEPPRQTLIVVSHDDYTKVQGGVQLCLQREQGLASRAGFRYLQLHPWHPLPRLAHAEEDADTLVALLLDGEPVGACRTSALIAAAGSLADGPAGISVVVHHLLGHLPEQIAALAKAAGGRCVFWLHDFFSICPNYDLQRNDLTFCGAPEVASNACMLCIYGEERARHWERMRLFFASVEVDVASPSASTADLWERRSGLRASSLTVLPHVRLDVEPDQGGGVVEDAPVTVAHLGAPVDRKGWPVFVHLMMQARAEEAPLRFAVLSADRPDMPVDDWQPVSVSRDSLNAMADAVAAKGVDLVLHWPTWPETFSFTTYEALAGSAFVVTNEWSGNVAATVRATGRGAVLQDRAELAAFFADGRAQALAQARREAAARTRVIATHGDLSMPLITGG